MSDGYSVLNSTEAREKFPAQTRYARRLAAKRDADDFRQWTNFGLTLGWCCTLLGGFCWFCVISRLDWLWLSLLTIGLALLAFGTILPQALRWPHCYWMKLAHLQGRIVMWLLLSVVYFTLIAPLGWWERRRRGSAHPFYAWDDVPPTLTSGWEPLTESAGMPVAAHPRAAGKRSLIWLFGDTLAFFAYRGHWLLLPILLVLLLLGLILFFVQSSALAPFIYTIAVAG